jgi:diguanylate cyclase (GGDEF)-like protein
VDDARPARNPAGTTDTSTASASSASPTSALRLRLLLTFVIGSGALVVVTRIAHVVTGPPPPLWRLAAAATLFYLGERAMFHLRFGQDQQSFNWLETATVVGLVILPSPWLSLMAATGACLVHAWRRRPPVKIAFNTLSCATGVFLARTVTRVVLGGAALAPLHPRTWLALTAGSFALFLWNGITVSLAVAYSQGLRFRDVQTRGFILNVLVWMGNTALGLLVVAMATAEIALLALLPVLLLLLTLAYRSYIQAIYERDTWEVLQSASRELLQVEEDELVEVVLDRSASLFDADLVEVHLFDGEDGAAGRSAMQVAGGPTKWRIGAPAASSPVDVWDRVLSEREPFVLSGGDAAGAVNGQQYASFAVAPLMIQGSCVGALRLGFSSARTFTRRQRQVFATFSNNVSSAIHNARLFADSRRVALHDPLTGLPNRVLLLDRLAQALERNRRRGGRVAVLFLDLDRFKVVNDSLGHDVGDRLLIATAQRMTAALRPGDTATRFGGDEFVVVCEEIESEQEAVDIADRLATALLEPFDLGDREMFVTVSVGVAVSSADDDQPNSLIRDADAAMYLAKSRGRARVEVFDSQLREDAIERLDTENDLRRAIDRGELCVFYQPVIDVDSGTVSGCEALVRWQHPQRGLILPAAFIPLAEETGLIGRLTQCVLEQACQQLREWRAGGHLPDTFAVAVNLSAREVAEPGLVETIAESIARNGIDARQLCLEITETALLHDIDAALAALGRLRRLGVRIALDDFGTGYSSLSYLRRLPVDVLKIDRSFIGRLGYDVKDRAVVAGMIDLAHALNLSVIAEGVETHVQLAELAQLGCDAAQGWYFSASKPAVEVREMMRRYVTVPG